MLLVPSSTDDIEYGSKSRDGEEELEPGEELVGV